MNLPRERVEHDLPPEERSCPCCKREMRRAGFELSDELEYVPASLRVIEHTRVKYACPSCEEHGVHTAPMPPRPIEKGRPGPGLLAQVIVSKYEDHQPLHRQEAIYERQGASIARSTMCDWLAAAAALLEPIATQVKRSVLESAVIQSDDTSVLCLLNGEGAGKRRSYLWVYVGDRNEVVYDFTLDRSRDGPIAFLGDWGGLLQVDGYSGYDELFRSGRVVEVGCWAHVRRKYFDALPSAAAEA